MNLRCAISIPCACCSSLLGIAHLEQLPGIRWKLRNLAQLQKTDARRFAEQAELLATRLE